MPDADDSDALAGKLFQAGLFRAGDLEQEPGDESEPTLLPGRQLGKFQIERFLGRGGLGEVYLARDESLRRQVALKILTRATGKEVERFRREATLLARLAHPNIVSVFEFGEIEGLPIISMQYVPGEPIDRRSLTVGEVLKAMRDVALAAHYAHERGIVHRDIKPSNILLDGKGHVTLTDFGVAREYRDREFATISTPGIIVGTPEYMAPEQARGDAGAVGPWTDVYSLGATLYRLLTGRPPFRGGNVLEVLQSVAGEEPARPGSIVRGIPPEVDAVVLRAMDKDPARRYGSAAELAEDLRRLREGEPIRARPPGLARRILRGVKKNKIMALGSALLLAAAGVVAALGLEIRQASRRNRADRLLFEGRMHTRELSGREGLRSRQALLPLVTAANSLYDEAARLMPEDPRPSLLRALTWYWAGDAGEAERELSEAQRKLEGAPEFWVSMVRARIRLDRWLETAPVPRALPAASGSRAEEVGPSPDSEAEAVLQELREARAHLEAGQAILDVPLEEVHFLRGSIALLEGDWAAARVELEKESEEGPLAPRAARLLWALVQIRQGRYEEAQDVLRTLVRDRYRRPLSLALLSAASLSAGNVKLTRGEDPSGDYEEVLRSARHAMAAGAPRLPLILDRARAWMGIGLVEVRRSRNPIPEAYAQAWTEAEGLKKEAPDRPEPYELLAEIHTRLAQYKLRQFDNVHEAEEDLRQARRSLDEAQARSPGRSVARKRAEIALALAEAEAIREGRISVEPISTALDEIRKDASVESRALIAKGLALMGRWGSSAPAEATAHFASAVKECRAALAEEPANPNLLTLLGSLYLDWGEVLANAGEDAGDLFEQALTSLEDACRLAPSDPEAAAFRGRARAFRGQQMAGKGEDPVGIWRQGVSDLTETLRDHPRHLPARQALARLTILLRSQLTTPDHPLPIEFELAPRYIAELRTLNPNDPETLLLQAWLEYESGASDRARETMDRCVRIHRGYARRRWR